MPPGVRQVLEKKEGLFRRNMMGKRVNFACRSVISPDPYIDTHEVGLPLRFAKKLTFPEPVTPFNFDSLRQAVVNGPDVHPGANYVEDEFGQRIDLARRTKEEREAIAQRLRTPAVNAPSGKCKIVYRQLVSGDVMLANRQPTLTNPQSWHTLLEFCPTHPGRQSDYIMQTATHIMQILTVMRLICTFRRANM